jgi:photosystem II stability/assembly factor-like uncharacterized protein
MLVSVAIMLVACSPDDDNADAKRSGRPAPSTSTSTVTAPASGGHLHPSPVLFGSRVMVREPSGGLRDVTPEKADEESIVDAFFVDPEHGWVALNDFGRSAGRLVRTVDGGHSWEATDLAFSQHPSAGSYVRIHFFDRERGWVTMFTATADGGQGIVQSTDGGRTWSVRRRESEPLIAGPIRFVSPSHGWVAGGSAPGAHRGLLETFDAGRMWKARSVDPPPGAPGDVVYQLPAFFGPWGVLAVGVVGDERLGFSTSADGGRSWRLTTTLREAGSAEGFVSIVTPELWWVITEDASTVLVTSDAGRTWQRRSTSGLSGVLQDLEAEDGLRAWVRIIEAGRPTIEATTDGGATWRPMFGP